MTSLPLIQMLVYSLTLWLGLYLLARGLHTPGLRYAGLGLVSYAAGLAVVVLYRERIETSAWLYLPVMLPALFWLAATHYLVPDVPDGRLNIAFVVAMAVVVVLTSALVLFNPTMAQQVVVGIPIIFVAGAMLRVRQAFASKLPRQPLIVLFLATIFFGLSAGLIVLPLRLFVLEWVLVAISFDIVLVGFVVAVLDAYDEGTTVLPDILRSLAAALPGVLVFGGQAVVVMAVQRDTSLPMMALLFGLISTFLIIHAFYDTIQSLLDSAIFARMPGVKAERDKLRAVSTAAARVDTSLEFAAMDEEEFVRLTRRAIGHYSDLHKLASSPLIRLPLIDARLQSQDDNLLARANKLKALLRESIEQLKPDDTLQFSTADEWRYYNALYFPYVLGIKPYSRRYLREEVDGATAEALDWFRTYIPERTLYNWQNTAARLVAQYLREMMNSH